MPKNKFKRILILDRTLALICMLNILFGILNEFFFKLNLPENVQGYIFFLSSGLYLGFLICKNEYDKIL